MRLIHCAECGRNKPLHAKGLCKPCYNRRWHEAHREERAEYNRQWALAHPEEDRERKRRWREGHREEEQERNRQYRAEHPEQGREYGRRWRAANPEKERERVRRRRARKKEATIEFVDEVVIFERDGYMCVYCGGTHEKLTLDHIVALDNGGSHCEDNLLVACGRCNSSKGTRLLKEWLLTQEKALAWIF